MVMHAPSTLYVRIRKMNAAVDAACTAPRSRQTRLTHPSLQRGRECFRHCSITSGTLAHRAAYALSKLYHLLGPEELSVATPDRKSVMEGKRESVRVTRGGSLT